MIHAPLRALHDAVRQLGSLSQGQEICEAAVEHAQQALRGRGAVLLLPDSSQQTVAAVHSGCHASEQAPAAHTSWLQPRAQLGLVQAVPLGPIQLAPLCVARQARALRITDLGCELEVYAGVQFAVVDAPNGLGLLGVLGVEDLDEAQLELLCALATVTGVSLRQVSARQQASHEAGQRARLARYFSAQVVDHLLHDAPAIHGQRFVATVLFSDIRGFTAMSQGRDPAEVLALLNACFAPLTAAVFEHGGVVDKLIGDGMLAVFGVPEPSAHHARDAVRCALALVDRMAGLDLSTFGLGGVRIGVGLHSGPLIAGDLGGSDFIDYTVLGDTVNVASRIEGANKQLGTSILISEATRLSAGGRFECRPQGLVALRGVDVPIELHALTTPGSEVPSQ